MAEAVIQLSVQFKDAVANFRSLVETYQKELEKLTPGTSIYKGIQAQLKQAQTLVKRTDLQANIGITKESQLTKMTADLEAVQHILGTVKESFSSLGFKDINLGHASFEQFRNDVKAIENEINALNHKKQELENLSVAGALNKAGLSKDGFNKSDLDKGVIQYYNEVTAAIQKAEQAIVKLQEQQQLLNTSISSSQGTLDSTKNAHFLNNLYNSFGKTSGSFSRDALITNYSNMLTEQHKAGTLNSAEVQNALKMIGLDDATINAIITAGKDASQRLQQALTELSDNKLKNNIKGYLNTTYGTDGKGGIAGMQSQSKAYDAANKSLTADNARLAQITKDLTTQTKNLNRYQGRQGKLDGVVKDYSTLQNNLNTLSQRITTLEQQVANSIGKGLGTGNAPTGDPQASGGLAKQDAQLAMGTAIDNMARRWIGTYAIVNKVRQAIRQAWNDIKGLDKAMTDIAVVTEMSVDELWGKIDQYMDIAQQYGVTTQGVYEVSQIYYQQGLGTAEVMAATTETLKMARIAGMDYKEAADAMTVAIRAFKMEMTDAAHVTDVYSKVAAITASDSNELATAMSKTASSAENVGSNFENTTAMLAVMIETTRESAQNLGSALKSIISRYGEMKVGLTVDSEGEEIDYNKVDTALKSVGISIKDAQGQFRDFDDVIFELSEKWDTLDKNTQRYIATIMAGNRQQSRFIALVDNWERLEEVSDAANSEADDAGLLQYSKTLDSLDAKINNLKNSFQELYMSIANGAAFKGLLDWINGFLNGFTKLKTGFATFLPGLIVSIKSIFTLIKMLSSNMFSGLYANATNSATQVAQTTITIHRQTEQAKTQTTEAAVQERATIEMTSAQQTGQQKLVYFGKGALTKGTSGWAAGTKGAGFAGMGLSLIGTGLTLHGANVAGQGGSQNLKSGANLTAVGNTLSGAGMGFMMGGPWGVLAGAILGGIGSVIEAINIANDKVLLAQEDLKKAQEEEEEAKIEAAEKRNESNTLEEYINKLSNLSSERFLSDEKQQEWIDLNNEIYEKYPELATHFDDLGNATISLAEAQSLLQEATLEQLEAERKYASSQLKTAQANQKLVATQVEESKRSFFVGGKQKFDEDYSMLERIVENNQNVTSNYQTRTSYVNLSDPIGFENWYFDKIFTKDNNIDYMTAKFLERVFNLQHYEQYTIPKDDINFEDYFEPASIFTPRNSNTNHASWSEFQTIMQGLQKNEEKSVNSLQNVGIALFSDWQRDYVRELAENGDIKTNRLYASLDIGDGAVGKLFSKMTPFETGGESIDMTIFTKMLDALLSDDNFVNKTVNNQWANEYEMLDAGVRIFREQGFVLEGILKEYSKIQIIGDQRTRAAERQLNNAAQAAADAQIKSELYYSGSNLSSLSNMTNIMAQKMGQDFFQWQGEKNSRKESTFDDYVITEEYKTAYKNLQDNLQDTFVTWTNAQIESYNNFVNDYQKYSSTDFDTKLKKLLGEDSEAYKLVSNFYSSLFEAENDNLATLISFTFDTSSDLSFDKVKDILEKIPMAYYGKIGEMSEQLASWVESGKLSESNSASIMSKYLEIWTSIDESLVGDAKARAQAILANGDYTTSIGLKDIIKELEQVYSDNNIAFDLSDDIKQLLPNSLENLKTSYIALAEKVAASIDTMSEQLEEGQKGFSSMAKALEYADKYDLSIADFEFDEGTWKLTTDGLGKVLEKEQALLAAEMDKASEARDAQIETIKNGQIGTKFINDFIATELSDGNKQDLLDPAQIFSDFYTEIKALDIYKELGNSLTEAEYVQFQKDWKLSNEDMLKLFDEKDGKYVKKDNTQAPDILKNVKKQVIQDKYIDLNNIISANWQAYLDYYYDPLNDQKLLFSEWLEKQGEIEEEALKEQVKVAQQYLDKEAIRNINIEKNKEVFKSLDLNQQRRYDAYQILINNYNKLTDEMLGTIAEDLGIDAGNLKNLLEYDYDTGLYSFEAGFENSDIFKELPVYVQNALLNIFQQQTFSAKEALNNLAKKIGSGETETIGVSDYQAILGDSASSFQRGWIKALLTGVFSEEQLADLTRHVSLGHAANQSEAIADMEEIAINWIAEANNIDVDEAREKWNAAKGTYKDSVEETQSKLYDLYLKLIDGTITEAEKDLITEYEAVAGINKWTGYDKDVSVIENYLNYFNSLITDATEDAAENRKEALTKAFEKSRDDSLGKDFDAKKAIKEADGFYDKDNIIDILNNLGVELDSDELFGTETTEGAFKWDSKTGDLVLGSGFETWVGALDYAKEEAIRAIFSVPEAEKVLNKKVEFAETQESIQSTLEDFYGDLSSITLSQLAELYKQVTGKDSVDSNTVNEYERAINEAKKGSFGSLLKVLKDIQSLPEAAKYNIDTSALEAAYKDAVNSLIQSLISMLSSAVEGTLSATDMLTLAEKTGLNIEQYATRTVDGWKLSTEGLLAVGAKLEEQYGNVEGVTESIMESLVGEGKSYSGLEDIQEAIANIEAKINSIKGSNSELTKEYDAQLKLLREMENTQFLDPNDPRFNFMDKDSTRGFANGSEEMAATIQTALDALSTLRSGEAIDADSFYNMFDQMYAFRDKAEFATDIDWIKSLGFTPEALNELSSAEGKVITSYEDFVTAMMSQHGALNEIDGDVLLEMGLNIEAAAGATQKGLREVADQQINFLKGIKAVLEAMGALEELGEFNLELGITSPDGTPITLQNFTEFLDVPGIEKYVQDAVTRLQTQLSDLNFGEDFIKNLFGSDGFKFTDTKDLEALQGMGNFIALFKKDSAEMWENFATQYPNIVDKSTGNINWAELANVVANMDNLEAFSNGVSANVEAAVNSSLVTQGYNISLEGNKIILDEGLDQNTINSIKQAIIDEYAKYNTAVEVDFVGNEAVIHVIDPSVSVAMDTLNEKGIEWSDYNFEGKFFESEVITIEQSDVPIRLRIDRFGKVTAVDANNKEIDSELVKQYLDDNQISYETTGEEGATFGVQLITPPESEDTVAAIAADVQTIVDLLGAGIKITVEDENTQTVIETILASYKALEQYILEHPISLDVSNTASVVGTAVQNPEGEGNTNGTDLNALKQTIELEWKNLDGYKQEDLDQPINVEYKNLKTYLPTITQKVNLDYSENSTPDVGESGTTGATGNVNLMKYGAALAKGTLMGELGPELYVQGGQYRVAGANGPEFVDLQSDAIVFNHLQTAKLLNNGHVSSHGSPVVSEHHAVKAYAAGNVNGVALAGGREDAIAAINRAIAIWQGIKNASLADMLGSGGGGGSGNSIQAVTAELIEWYNLTRKIAKVEADINQLTAERENIHKRDGAAYLRNLREETKLLQEQHSYNATLRDYKKAQLDRQAREINENQYWSQFMHVDENGLLQYNFGNETDGGKGTLKDLQDFVEMSGEEQQAFLQKIGYSYTTADGEVLEGTELAEMFLEEAQAQIDNYDALYDSWRELGIELENLEQQVAEIEEEIKNNQIELEQDIYDIIVEVWEKEIEAMEEHAELVREAGEEYVSGLRDAVSAEKDMYDRNQATADREQLQRQLALLRRSGGSASEIANLENQLDDMFKDEYFNNQEQMIEDIAKANDEQNKKLEEQIRIQQESLEYQKEHGLIWQQVYDVMSGTTEEILAFMQGRSTEFFTQSLLGQEEMLTEWAHKVGIYTEERAIQSAGSAGLAQYWDSGAVWNNSAMAGLQNFYNSMSQEDQDFVRKQFATAYGTAINNGSTEAEAYQAAVEAVSGHLGDRQSASMAQEQEASHTTQGTAADYRYVQGGNLHLRANASTSSTSYGTYGTGTKVKVLSDEGEWCKVEVNGKTGYMMSKYLAKSGGGSGSGSGTSSDSGTTTTYRQQATAKGANGTEYSGRGVSTNSLWEAQQIALRYLKQNIANAGTTMVGSPSYSAYAQGGLVDYTGIAMVHGKPSKPEAFLNASQTKLISDSLKIAGDGGALDHLRSVIEEIEASIKSFQTTNYNNSSVSIAPGAITIQVAELADSYDIEDISRDIMDRISTIAAKATSRSVNRR